jgi:ATP-dependent RNA helicase RhlE
LPFATLGLGSKLAQALKEKGYVEPTPIQAKAIPTILAGRDVIGVAQTGTGKTAAFVLPLLEKMAATPSQRTMRVLVIAPTRELVAQIEENVRAYGRHLPLRYATIFGGVGEGPQIQALRRGVDLVVATPGRLIDLMEQRHVDFSALQVLVLDEADRMLDMGFLPAIRRIVAKTPAARQTLLFSATMSKEIEGVAKDVLKNPVLVEIGARSTPAEAVTQYVVEVSPAGKVPALIHLLKDAALESVLVFSRTKHGADRIARKLSAAGLTTATLHSNRTQGQRLQALRRFKSGDVRVLIATDIAARGIDVDGISHVINFDFPPQPEDYVHRIGRTGRAQAIGDAISFATHEDADSVKRLERFLGRGIARKKLEGYVAAVTAPAATAAPQDRAKGPWRSKNPKPNRFGRNRFGQNRGKPQGRRGRT